MTTVNIEPSVIESLRHRRQAGEKLSALAKEVGLPWQRLWGFITSAPLVHIGPEPLPPVAVSNIATPEQIAAATAEHRAIWARNPKWAISTRPDDPALGSIFTDAAGAQHVVTWVWRTAMARQSDGELHLALIAPDGRQWGESGHAARKMLKGIRSSANASAPVTTGATLKVNRPGGPLVEKYRPPTLDAIWGQEVVVKVLQKFASEPTSCAFVFDGETGTGKTTAALALAAALGCDVKQAEFGGVFQVASGEQSADAVRDITRLMWNAPMYGSGWKVVIVNEADRMHVAAETIWLDRLENLPPRTVVIFTTNYADKMSARFRDRCTGLTFESDACKVEAAVRNLLEEMWRAETGQNMTPPAVLDRIIGQTVDAGKLSFRRAVQALAIELAST